MVICEPVRTLYIASFYQQLCIHRCCWLRWSIDPIAMPYVHAHCFGGEFSLFASQSHHYLWFDACSAAVCEISANRSHRRHPYIFHCRRGRHHHRRANRCCLRCPSDYRRCYAATFLISLENFWCAHFRIRKHCRRFHWASNYVEWHGDFSYSVHRFARDWRLWCENVSVGRDSDIAAQSTVYRTNLFWSTLLRQYIEEVLLPTTENIISIQYLLDRNGWKSLDYYSLVPYPNLIENSWLMGRIIAATTAQFSCRSWCSPFIMRSFSVVIMRVITVVQPIFCVDHCVARQLGRTSQLHYFQWYSRSKYLIQNTNQQNHIDLC